MDGLDIKTLFLMLALGNIFTAVFFSLYVYLYNIRKSNLSVYVLGKVLLAMAWALFAFRDVYIEPMYIGLANSFLLFGLGYEVYCMVTVDTGYNRRNVLKITGVSLLLSSLFISILSTTETFRVFVMSFLASGYFGYVIYRITYTTHKSKMQYVLGILAIFLGSLFAVRGYIAITEGAKLLYSSTLLNIMVYVSNFIITYSWPIIYLFLLKERDEMLIVSKSEQIEEDNQILNSLNSTKNKLFAIIAHDLRNPFNAMLRFQEILVEKVKEQDYTELDIISKHLLQATRQNHVLLENLLQWANIQTDQTAFKPQKLIVRNVLQTINQQLLLNINEKQIKLFVSCSSDIQVYADPYMFGTIVRNLISNAIKFTPEGGRILISAEAKEKNVEVAIKDSGVGISEEVIGSLFTLGKVESTQGTNKELGSGLGLILCDEFVRKHNGRIEVESSPGKGSTFTIYLPQTT